MIQLKYQVLFFLKNKKNIQDSSAAAVIGTLRVIVIMLLIIALLWIQHNRAMALTETKLQRI